MADFYATIIGSGIIGCAIAYELSKTHDPKSICVLEKSPYLPAENQTARNSGVVHAGIYYDKIHSPLKAELCVKGNKLLYEFCTQHNVAVNQTGKLIVATNREENTMLDVLLKRAEENKVPRVTKLRSEEIQEYEPNVKAYSALWVPTSGIVDPVALSSKLRELSGLEEHFVRATKVTDLTSRDDGIIVRASTGGGDEYDFSSHNVINAAGLYSDEVARMFNPEFPLRIFPVRGEFAKFYPRRNELSISRNVYPTPEFYIKPDGSEHLTLGVHLTPTFGKEMIVGPLNRKRGSQVGREDFGSDLAAPVTFLKKIKPYFPHINQEDLSLHYTGIQAVLENGADFHIAPDALSSRMINLVGICSPGLTSSLAIAKEVTKLVQ